MGHMVWPCHVLEHIYCNIHDMTSEEEEAAHVHRWLEEFTSTGSHLKTLRDTEFPVWSQWCEHGVASVHVFAEMARFM